MPAIDTRPEPRPRTRTTGVRPIRPRSWSAASHRLPSLVLEDEVGPALRRDALTRGQVSFFQTTTATSSRSIARRAGCHDQPCRFSSCQVPSTV